MQRKRRGLKLCLFPGYRWCGPGCSGPGEPINDIDACCMRHDHCYDRGIPHCQCDLDFLECLHNRRNRYTQKGRNAELMYQFMKAKTSITCGRLKRYNSPM